ncbi:MAG TPA: hypothetical protein VNN80_19660 [Polyangiaceae bacterium]|jgi:hemolysin III|nr:hypothetical protein [Polyangiaceae bacterium]
MQQPLVRPPLDGGPIYTETGSPGMVAEPFNAASALLYLALGVYWGLRLRRRGQTHGLLRFAVPVLTLGGLGGTLYHGLRTSRFFLIMDYGAIVLLALAASGTFARKLLGSWRPVLIILALVIAAQQGLVGAARAGQLGASVSTAINLSYVVVALTIAVPLGIYTVREAPRLRRRLALIVLLYAVGLSLRALDTRTAGVLSMGTHWLWHVVGAAATALLLDLVEQLLDSSVQREGSRGAA